MKIKSNAVKNSLVLHQGIQTLRNNLKQNSQIRKYGTLLNSPDSKVLFNQLSDQCFEFQLNQNKTLNSLDFEMVQQMLQKVKLWSDGGTDKPRVAFISGTGGKAFCAGGDIVSLYNANIGKQGYDKSIKREFFAQEYLLDYSLTTMSPLQIAIWNGIVMGGGVGVSCHSKIRIATDNTVYAMPETGIGFFTDVGGSYFLSRVHNNISLGLYLGLTGFRLKSRDLVRWGVATHFVPFERLEALKYDISQNAKKQNSIEDIQNIVNKYHDPTDTDSPIENIEQINQIFTAEGTIHDLIKRLEQHNSEFSLKTIKNLQYMSPLSLGVVYEQIKRGKSMNLKEVFEMEFKISQGFMNHTEFFEGVRALLIDKDKKPKWKYSTVQEVPQKDIEWFFNRDDSLNLDISKYQI